jgi:hypothetical protein
MKIKINFLFYEFLAIKVHFTVLTYPIKILCLLEIFFHKKSENEKANDSRANKRSATGNGLKIYVFLWRIRT